jgi:hypothetical protein
MRTLETRQPRRGLGAIALLLTLVVAACAPGAPADGPGAVVAEALAKVAAKDIDGLRGLACAGQEDRIRDQLGLPAAMGGELLPGLDTQALVDAVGLDVSGVDVGEAAIEGDTAEVPVSGTIKVTFDAEAMRPVLRELVAAQGTTMTDEQLDALLTTLAAYGQDLPFDETIRVVREDGAWRICQDAGDAGSG